MEQPTKGMRSHGMSLGFEQDFALCCKTYRHRRYIHVLQRRESNFKLLLKVASGDILFGTTILFSGFSLCIGVCDL